MKRLLYILFLLCPTLLFADALTDCFAQLEKRTLRTDFAVTAQADATQPMTYSGSITMQGDKFVVSIMDMEVAYDGKTLYTYDESNNELTLSQPTFDELTEVNPLLFAKAIMYNSERTVSDQGDTYKITLVPYEKSAGVQSFVLILRKSDLMPLSAIMKETVSKQTTLKLLNPQFVTEAPSYSIRKEGAYINDLR